MKVTLNRVDDAFHFEANGNSAVKVHIDAAENIGGHNAGARPMELLLMGLGGCLSIDVILILKKQRQEPRDIKLIVSSERKKIEGTEMSPFTDINVHFELYGDLDSKKVKKALELSMEKYCSATAQFAGSAVITHSFELLG
jgi:putative redox protein